MPKYSILGGDLQVVMCDLTAGEKVIAETGHLLMMTDALSLDTTTGGGFLSGIKRAFGGSSFFINEISASAEGRAVFSSPTPGKIQELDVDASRTWMCQPHVFLCADSGISIEASFTQKFGAGLFGGSGFVLQSLKGNGKAFVHVGGSCLHLKLAAGQSIRVETGALAAFESSVSYDIQMVHGLKSILFSGEGLWFAHLTGPGDVYIQSLALPKLAHAISPYMPALREDASTGGVLGGVIGSILRN